ncbi:MAG: DUF2177 family protein [Halanaerobiales bacterium]|nr:DUF2177 family protein [Halanaerobiales bacterium]
MYSYFKVYILAFLVFILIDSIWLGSIAKKLYRKQIGFLMKENFDMKVALIFYLVFIVGLLFFVLNNAIINQSWQYALFAGMFYGFITYATYDITNLATIKDWPVFLTVIDIIWGSVLCGTTSIITYLIAVNIDFFKV